MLTVVFDARAFLGLFAAKESEWAYGGAEIQLSYLAKALADAGVDVVLLGNESRPSISYEGIRYCRIPKYLQNDVPKFLRVLNIWHSRWPKSLKRLSKTGSNVVYIQTQLECHRMTKNAKRVGVKVVRRVNGDSLVDGKFDLPPVLRAKVDRLLMLADAIVVQSDYQKTELLHNYGLESTVIDSLRPEITVTPAAGRYTVAWVGRCDSVKRPEIFLELAQALPELDFTMVMPPGHDKDLFESIEAQASSIDNLSLVRGLPHDEILALYGHSIALISTSDTEGLPNTFIEAMLCQTPIVSLVVNPAEMLTEEHGCYWCEGSLDSLVNHLKRIVSEPALSEEMGSRARSYAETRWSNRRIANEYVALFKRLFEHKQV